MNLIDTPHSEALLEVRGLTKDYNRERFHRRAAQRLRREGPDATPLALDDVSLAVKPGETVGIVGETGSGKSTLAQCIVGLVSPTQGEILLNQKAMSQTRKARIARALDVQMIFQDPHSSLNPRRRVGSMLREVLRVHKLCPPTAVNARIDELLEMVGLASDTADRYPRHLSGGQRQRVAIARALAFRPKLVVADEVVSALDAAIQAQILNLLRDLHEQTGMTLILISHNLAVVRYVCQRIGIMYRGKLVEEGPTSKILQFPQHEYTRTLLGAVLPVPIPEEPRMLAAQQQPLLAEEGDE